MKLDRKLNFVIPIYENDEKTVRAYVHSTPITSEVSDRYFMILAQTFAAIFNRGLGVAAGPGVALRLLQHIATTEGVWENIGDAPGVKTGLVEEIRRLTMILVPAGAREAWQQVPLQVAVDRQMISDDDRSEVENAIVFFIAVSATLARVQRKAMLEAASGLWNAQISSLTSTEFAASLRTSTATGSSGAKPPADAAPPAAPGGPANAVVDGKPSQLPV